MQAFCATRLRIHATAAPELVISEGLYVGSAVDIWSCGVILYAMLAGYLPFDDDPANPDGDNINLLYRYIVNTPLTFPDYVSEDARDLLSLMLVPDPTQRADLMKIMTHHWLKPYAHLFDRSVQDLERLAMEQHQMKRLAYQRQMKQQAAAAAAEQQKIQRSQSARMDIPPIPSSGQRARQAAANQEFLYEANPDESLFASPTLPSVTHASRRHPASVAVGTTSSAYDDDPFGPPVAAAPAVEEPAAQDEARGESRTRARSGSAGQSSRKQPPPVAVAPVKMSPERRKKDRQRHTIQLEYGGDVQEDIRPAQPPAQKKQKAKEQSRERLHVEPRAAVEMEVDPEEESPLVTVSDAVIPGEVPASSIVQQEASTTKPLPSPPSMNGFAASKKSSAVPISASQQDSSSLVTSESQDMQPPILSVTPTSPPRNEFYETATNGAGSVNSTGSGSNKSRHRKGISVDKFVGKFWGAGSETEGGAFANGVKARRPSDASAAPYGGKRPSTLEVSAMSASPDSKSSVHSNVSATKNNEGKKSRRNTLTVMVEPLSKRISQRSKGRTATGDSTTGNGRMKEKPVVSPTVVPPKSNGRGRDTNGRQEDVAARHFPPVDGTDIPASTSKASKVMQWFRNKSKSRATSPSGEYEDADRAPTPTPTADSQKGAGPAASTDTIGQAPHVVVHTPATPLPPPKAMRSPAMGRAAPSHVSETSIPATPSHHVPFLPRTMNRLSNMVASPQQTRVGYNKQAIRLHHGAVDQTTVTTGSPPDVMAHVTKVLLDMGLEVQQESEYKYRCIRTKKKKVGTGSTAGGLTAFTMTGAAASNGVDKRGLPIPSQSPFTSTGGMLKGLLMRRQSSQVSAHPSFEGEGSSDAPSTSRMTSHEKLSTMPVPSAHEPVYGERTVDQGDEVRFSVELTRIDGLDDTFSLDIRRLKGHLRSYKFLYDTLRERCNLSR
ncbi:Pkinase-domain-containing protein [Phellopilus nigrolimitatus]|nr:Pkinase-domain-containing protein [Phellopilus nigrolimitatus]